MLTRRTVLKFLALIPLAPRVTANALEVPERVVKLKFQDGTACCRVAVNNIVTHEVRRTCHLDQIFVYEGGELIQAEWQDIPLLCGDTLKLDVSSCTL